VSGSGADPEVVPSEKPGLSNLAKRLLSAGVLVPIVLLLIFFSSPLVFRCLIAVIGFLAALEHASITLSKDRLARRLVIGLLGGAVACAVGFFPVFPPGPLVVLGALPILVFFLFMFGSADHRVLSKRAAFASAGALYTGGLVGFIALVFGLPSGPFWVVTLLAGTFLGDTMAYVFGKSFGRHKLAPRLSPGKTWEGSLGGLVGATLSLGVCRFIFFPDNPLWPFLLLALPLSLLCQIGDLAESLLKRSFEVKDSGNLIPGHGGLLDRIDALMFSAPLIYLFARFFG